MRSIFLLLFSLAVFVPQSRADIEIYKDGSLTLTGNLDIWALASSQSNAFYIDEPDVPATGGKKAVKNPHNRDFDFFQYSVHPQLYFESGNFYGGLSGIYSATEGDGEPFEYGDHNKTKNDTDLENAYIGWRGEMVDFSVGAQVVEIADGLLLADGRADYATAWLAPRSAFENTTVARFDFGIFKPTAFYLQYHDESGSPELAGADLQLQDEELGTAGIYGFRVFDAAVDSDRKGLNVLGVYANGNPVASLPQLNLEFSVIRQENSSAKNKKSAEGWYAGAGYDFEVASVFVRRSQFSGDKQSTENKSEAFDGFTPGLRDFGTWWTGEILAQQYVVNSNLRVWTLGARKDIDFLEGTTLGATFYNFGYDVKVESERELGNELDVFAEIQATEQISIVPLVGFLTAGDGAKKAHGSQSKTSTLVALIAGISF